MAYSTQRYFFNLQESNHLLTSAKNAKMSAIKLKSFGSSIDTRAIAIDKKGQKYCCDSNKFEEEGKGKDDSKRFRSLTDLEAAELKNQLLVLELAYKNSLEENVKLRQLLNTFPLNNVQLRGAMQTTESDHTDLSRQIKGISRSSEELDDLRQETTESESRMTVSSYKSGQNASNSTCVTANSTSEEPEPYEKVLHERNKLRYQLCRMAGYTDKIKLLKEKATRSECLEAKLQLANKRVMAVELAANRSLQTNCENETLRRQLRNAKIILCENFNLKREIAKHLLDLARLQNAERQLQLAKQSICQYQNSVRDYENRLKRLTSESRTTRAPDERVVELREALDATVKQMHLECQARSLLQIELETCKAELEKLHGKNKIINIQDENGNQQRGESDRFHLKQIMAKSFAELYDALDYSEAKIADDTSEDVEAMCARKVQVIRNQIQNMKYKYTSELQKSRESVEELQQMQIRTNNRRQPSTETSQRSGDIEMQEEMEKYPIEQGDLMKSFEHDLEGKRVQMHRSLLSLQSLQTQRDDLAKKCKDKENSMEKLKCEVTEREAFIESLRQRIIDMQNQIISTDANLKKVSAESSAQATEYLNKISSLEMELQNVKKEVSKKEELIKILEDAQNHVDDKRMVEVYALRRSEGKKSREISDLFDNVQPKSAPSPLRSVAERWRHAEKHGESKQRLDEHQDEKQYDKQKMNANSMTAQRSSDAEKLKLAPLAGLTLFSCYTPGSMTKLQIVCKKIFDFGIDSLTVKELTYLHCFICKTGAKQSPNIIDCIPREQRCCKCRNFSCCLPYILKNAEKHLDVRLNTIEKDVEILDKSLNFLKQNDSSSDSSESKSSFDVSSLSKPTIVS